MICRLFLYVLSAAIVAPVLWRYCFSHEPLVSEGTRKRLLNEHASSELIREQVEMPRGRRQKVNAWTEPSNYNREVKR